MALVEVARFAELTEAQVAASSLRASGVDVLLQNENWGQTEAYMQLAMGGFRLWTSEADAADAAAYIEELRGPAPPPAKEVAVVTLGALALATVGGLVGWMLIPLLQKRRIWAEDEADGLGG